MPLHYEATERGPPPSPSVTGDWKSLHVFPNSYQTKHTRGTIAVDWQARGRAPGLRLARTAWPRLDQSRVWKLNFGRRGHPVCIRKMGSFWGEQTSTSGFIRRLEAGATNPPGRFLETCQWGSVQRFGWRSLSLQLQNLFIVCDDVLAALINCSSPQMQLMLHPGHHCQSDATCEQMPVVKVTQFRKFQYYHGTVTVLAFQVSLSFVSLNNLYVKCCLLAIHAYWSLS